MEKTDADKGSYRYRCPWCGERRTREEMRGRLGGTGPVPTTCHRCRTENSELSWCVYHNAPHPVTEFPHHGGRPDVRCHHASYLVYDAPGKRPCPWCGDKKTAAEIKGPGAPAKGKAPTTCYDCRTSNPDHHWCTFHQRPHPRADFDVKKATGSADSWCRLARHEDRYGHLPLVDCPSCNVAQPAGLFMGRGYKKPTCKGCNDGHPGQKWCRCCSAWRVHELFPNGGANTGARCSMCVSANKHNTTVAEILRIQGVETPVCESCGAVDRLCVDHDHSCCSGMTSCGRCVLGYLCWRCNSAEGQLVTIERATALVEHMVRREKKIAERGAAEVA